MCLGKPLYSAPRLQFDAIKIGKFTSTHLRYLKRNDHILKSRLQNHMDIKDYEIVNEMTSLNTWNKDQDRITTLANVQNDITLTEDIIPFIAPPKLKFEDSISSALLLDLRLFPRPSRSNNNNFITLQKKQVSSQSIKLIILITAKNWGMDDASVTHSTKMRIARAASQMIAYDNGHLYEFSTCSVIRWDDGKS